MLSAELVAAIAGLAALDSLNPATVVGVALILLLPTRRPVASALAYVGGAYLTVLAAGVLLLVGAAALGEVLQEGTAWVRRGALTLAAVVLVVSGARRLRPRQRSAVALPAWFGPWTAAPLGVVATGADLPNAFPYLIAVERLAAAGVPVGTGVVVLALYALVYCLPCLVLLAVGATRGERITGRLRGLHDRFGAGGPQPRSLPVAVGLWLAAGAAVAVAVSI